MGIETWRWVVGCLLVLPGCGAAPAEPKRAPPPLASPATSARVTPPAISRAPLRVRIDPQPLSYPDVELAPQVLPPIALRPVKQTYALPLNRGALVNLQRDVIGHGLLSPAAPELNTLLARGSVVVDAPTWGGKSSRFDDVYAQLELKGVPILVTTDAVLHQQHVFFNEVLKLVELRTLEPMLRALLAGLYQQLASQLDETAPSEPLFNELAVLALARKQLEPELAIHPLLADRVALDLEAMRKHAGVALSATQSDELCLASAGRTGRCYFEDFSQYVARGHYTVTPVLARYFLASMWLGRMGRRFQHDSELAQQVLLVEAAKHATCKWRGVDMPASALLARLDQLLQYFIGRSDDLTLPEVDRVLRTTLGSEVEVELSGRVLVDLRRELGKLRAPRILSGVVSSYGKDPADTTKQETQGLRLLGQRFTPDSEVLGRLVFEHVGPNPEHPRFADVAKDAPINRSDYCDVLPVEVRQSLSQLDRKTFTNEASRCICERALTLWLRNGSPLADEPRGTELTQVCRLMPSALDVASVMGSALAEGYLAPSRKYLGYERELTALREAHATTAKGPPENLYAEWLRALTPLLTPLPTGYPTWMTSKAYQKKSMRTFMASWAELRQDTVLYVKQSYTGGRYFELSGTVELRPPEAYGMVEARPELYQRVKSFTTQLKSTLTALDALPLEVETSLERMSALVDRLQAISLLQLQGKPIEPADQGLIKHIGGHFLNIVQPMLQAVSTEMPEENEHGQRLTSVADGVDQALLAPLVADVHTDLHTGRVLEEATGPLEWMLVVSRMPDGKLAVSVGPVFSYKEFVHPLRDRLTNEKWRGALASGRELPAPSWWTSDRPLANGFELPRLPVTPR